MVNQSTLLNDVIADDFRTTVIAIFAVQILLLLAVGIVTMTIISLSFRATCSCSCCRQREKEEGCEGGIVAYNATANAAEAQEMSNAVAIPVAGTYL